VAGDKVYTLETSDKAVLGKAKAFDVPLKPLKNAGFSP